MEIVNREFIYIWHYFSIQFRQIFVYWVVGMVIGSAVSVLLKDKIHDTFSSMGSRRLGVLGIVIASALGIASPLCMYGTIPIAASFSQKGIKDDWLAAFMMSSVLLNPQLLIYSMALGPVALLIRLISCFVCGITAGLLIRYLCKDREFFDFKGFEPPKSRDTDKNILLRFIKNLGRNIKATGLYFLLGILLSALFQRYVPADRFAALFGSANEGFGVLMAATIGVPVYVCGGGTIPLLQAWLAEGMSMGSAAAFMITGPATKITNLGALKSALGIKRFIIYILYVMLFSLCCGMLVNLIVK